MVSAECYAHDENACREPRSSDTHAEKLCVLRVNRMYMRKMKKAYPKLALRLSKYQTSKIRKIAAAAAKK